MQLKIDGLASVIECLELLAEEMEKKRESTTVMARLPEENHTLAQRLQERTGWAESLMAELAEARDAVAARENDIEPPWSRLNNAPSTRVPVPRPDNVSDTDAIKLVGRLNAETFQSAALLAEAGRPLKDIDSYGYHPHQRDILWPQIRGLDRRSLVLPSGPGFSVVWRGLYERLVGWYATVECDGQRSATR